MKLNRKFVSSEFTGTDPFRKGPRRTVSTVGYRQEDHRGSYRNNVTGYFRPFFIDVECRSPVNNTRSVTRVPKRV